MSHASDDTRTYGMPDPTNRQPPGQQGLRGEQGAQQSGRPAFTHREHLPDGDDVEIEESSGVAFAEVMDRVGIRKPGSTS